MSTTAKSALGLAFAAALALAPSLAGAVGTSDANCLANVGLTKIGQATTSAQVITAGDCSINLRDVYLDAAITRVGEMEKVSSSTQQSLQATLQTTVGNLATIKTTLDADTSTTTAISDYHTIFTTVRVFALVLPRTWIYASSDRVMTITGDLQQVDNTLMADNQNATSSVQSENAPLFTDLATQMANTNTQAANAQSTVQPLMPDGGNQQIIQSNRTALQNARSMNGTALTDIQTALADIKQIRQNLGV